MIKLPSPAETQTKTQILGFERGGGGIKGMEGMGEGGKERGGVVGEVRAKGWVKGWRGWMGVRGGGGCYTKCHNFF